MDIVLPSQVPATLRKWASLYRVHQWSKNSLVAIPLLASHQVLNSTYLIQTIIAFFSISFVASAGYILNDLRDLNADRIHSHKRHRMIASGVISKNAAIKHVILLAVVGLALGGFIHPWNVIALLAYLSISFCYSCRLKRVPLLDVTILALLYVYRILYGGLTCGITPTDWLLAFSFFFFFSLAMAKRYADFLTEPGQLNYRGYLPGDQTFVGNCGIGAGMIAIIVLAIYLKSDHINRLYARPDFLWMAMLMCFLWINRVWFLAGRGLLSHDPVTFALADPVSYCLGVGALSGIMLAHPK